MNLLPEVEVVPSAEATAATLPAPALVLAVPTTSPRSRMIPPEEKKLAVVIVLLSSSIGFVPFERGGCNVAADRVPILGISFIWVSPEKETRPPPPLPPPLALVVVAGGMAAVADDCDGRF